MYEIHAHEWVDHVDYYKYTEYIVVTELHYYDNYTLTVFDKDNFTRFNRH